MSNITFVRGCSEIVWTTFSDGTEACEVIVQKPMDPEKLSHIQIVIEDGTRDIVRLGLVKDALSRLGINEVMLTLMYVPQARADRVFHEGMAHPLKVFSQILNSYEFEEVIIYDPHSDVAPALIDRVTVVDQTQMLKGALPVIKRKMPEFKLCAPDLGATKKIFDTVMALGHDDYIQAVKIRDTRTGNIIKCDVLTDEVSGDILIVDDISDRGGSFKFLAQKLKERGASRVGLFITHGIFPDGLKSLEKDIDFIWCASIVGNYINNEDFWRFNER